MPKIDILLLFLATGIAVFNQVPTIEQQQKAGAVQPSPPVAAPVGNAAAMLPGGTADTGRRHLSVQLRPPPEDKIKGMIITPPGQRLNSGVTLAGDNKPLEGPLEFLTCIEGGCVAPVSFDTPTVALLKSGTGMKVSAVAINGGQTVVSAVSLKGFGEALNRTGDLLK